ncbi:hypothetical protein BH23GEM8_BH23GEM8_21090 [soil metagenome]
MPELAESAHHVPGFFHRLPRISIALLLLVAVSICARGAVAQTPPAPQPGDTIPRDTFVVRIPPEQVVSDTLPRDTLRTGIPDTLRPPPHLPRYPEPEQTGWAEGRWMWTRADLLRYHGLSLLELLERTPGLVATRGGGAGKPAGVAALGQGGGRLRVFRDGFELDPLSTATLDLQHIGLLDIDQIRVERSLIETRIHLRTLQLEDLRPLSGVEVGTGNFNARFLRAMFSRPAFGHSVITAAYDVSSAGGFRLPEPSSFTSARLRWDLGLGRSTGLQLEYVQNGLTRESVAYPADFDRRELVLRARSRLGRRLTADLSLGHTSHSPNRDQDSITGAAIALTAATDTLDVALRGLLGGARAVYTTGFGFLEAGGQIRLGGGRGFASVSNEVRARAGLQPFPWLGAEAEVLTAGTSSGQVTALQATARSGGLLGFSLFGSLSSGQRWVTVREDSRGIVTDTIVVGGEPVARVRSVLMPDFVETATDVAGARFGLEWSVPRATFGAAVVTSAAGSVVPFGNGFDRGMPLVVVEGSRGVEGVGTFTMAGRLEGLSLEGGYTHWESRGGRPYLPAGQGRAAATFTGLFREGQLEPYARIEAAYRGSTLVPNPTRTGFVDVEGHTMLNFLLQIRIIDVRAFLVFDNVLNEPDAVDIPGRLLPAARTIYGVRWFFRN